ncbi:MAG: hypothetical protein LBP35_06980 [Candidatus Ancillula trichonymphae]|jgi:hypothetical protein|nr:hypothetical protein [Candidatus Ancillula trichonymphae]
MSNSFKQNLQDAIDKIQEAKESVMKGYEEAKTKAPEDTSDVVVVLQKTAELLGEGVAKMKLAYDEAGGITGISENATKKAAELSASAKIVYEDIVHSSAGQLASQGVQNSAGKISNTKVFQNARNHALKLKNIATETFEATYEAKQAEKAAQNPADAVTADA